MLDSTLVWRPFGVRHQKSQMRFSVFILAEDQSFRMQIRSLQGILSVGSVVLYTFHLNSQHFEDILLQESTICMQAKYIELLVPQALDRQ